MSNPFNSDYPLPLMPGLKVLFKLAEYKTFDVVHCHHPFNVGYFSRLLAQQYHAPLVFSYHTRYDIYANHYLKFLPKFMKNYLIEKSIKNFCRKTNLVITPSEFVKEKLLKSMPKLKVVTVASGLPHIPKLDMTKDKIRKKLKIPVNKKILLTVCRLAKEKNLNRLLQCIENLSNKYFLLIIGGGPYEKELKMQADKKRIQNRILFAGIINHENLAAYYQAADIFVYASVSETQGLVLLEALSFGLPVVAVDCANTREWVTDSTGRLARNNPKDLSDKIISLEKADMEEMAQKAKELAGMFTISKTADRILDEYRKLKFKFLDKLTRRQ